LGLVGIGGDVEVVYDGRDLEWELIVAPEGCRKHVEGVGLTNRRKLYSPETMAK
jgi:hypothetical protein